MAHLTLLLASVLIGAVPTVPTAAREPTTAGYSVGPQYDTTHVYVAPGDFDRFAESLSSTFGGTASTKGAFQVTPTASRTFSQLVLTPADSISVFGFTTPIPFALGVERNGYLVTNLDAAITSAVMHGATRLVNAFPDPINRDVVVLWPGGVAMELYWHTATPNYAALGAVPENRVYFTSDAANVVARTFTGLAHGRVFADGRGADGSEIGRPDKQYRRIRISSGYGGTAVTASDDHLSWPYGRDVTGYEVADLSGTLARAQAAGVETLVAQHREHDREFPIVRFPGGYIAEIHARVTR